MKKILDISAVFIGLVIGAGFASGREIFEYFNIPSQSDFTGLIVATISFGALSYITLDISRRNQLSTFDGLISHASGRLAPAIKLFMSVFMFCGFFVMMSACGALAEKTFGVPPVFGTTLLALVCFVVFSFDVKGLVACNSVMVPIMILGMLTICLTTLITNAAPAFASFAEIKSNPLVSALCYVSYNTITAGAVLVPLSAGISRRQALSVSVLSSSVIGLILFFSWLTMNLFWDGLLSSQMPLLDLAQILGKIQSTSYSLILFMALCTTAVSHGFGLLSKINFTKNSHRVGASALLCLTALPFSFFNFSDLVSNLYSTFGYIGFIWTGLLIFKYLKD